jgi:hypothetical protein
VEAGQRSTITANAPTVALPKTESEEMVAIRRVELRRIKDQVTRMGNPVESAAAWAYTWLGAVIAVVLSLGALYGSMDDKHAVAGWLLLVHWFALVSFGFLAWFSWHFDKQARNKRQTDHDVVVRELTAIEDRYE